MYFTIMDDDRAFGETLKNKLESEYHAVVDVYHGMIDLDQIKHVPDILFLDVIFENGTGVDYAKKFKEKFDSQIVFVSSKSSLIFKTQGLKALLERVILIMTLKSLNNFTMKNVKMK